MNKSAVAATVAGALLLGGSLASNAWQLSQSARLRSEVAARDAELSEAQQALRQLRAESGREIERLKSEVASRDSAMQQAVAQRSVPQTTITVSQAAAKSFTSTPTGGRTQQAEVYAPRSAEMESTPSPDVIKEAVRKRAKRYFTTEKRSGSGSTLVLGGEIEVNEPRARPGWSNRYEVTGEVTYQYYDSATHSYSNHRAFFTTEVEAFGGAVRVLDVTETLSRPM